MLATFMADCNFCSSTHHAVDRVDKCPHNKSSSPIINLTTRLLLQTCWPHCELDHKGRGPAVTW